MEYFCVRVAGAVPDPSYHGKQNKEEFIWYLQHLEVFSEHSLQTYVVGKLILVWLWKQKLHV